MVESTWLTAKELATAFVFLTLTPVETTFLFEDTESYLDVLLGAFPFVAFLTGA